MRIFIVHLRIKEVKKKPPCRPFSAKRNIPTLLQEARKAVYGSRNAT
jgi:hypothetical protein